MALELRAKGWYFDSTDLADFKARDVGEPQVRETRKKGRIDF
jgi:hypothetical protein